MKSTRPINKVIQEADSDLAILITRTRQLKRLTHILRKQVETDLADHCYVANIQQETLVILADSAARASKLRFYTTNLLETLPQVDPLFSRVKHIKVKVLNQSQHVTDTVTAKVPGLKMNQENAECIKTLADNVGDPELHDALARLARHAK